MHRMASITVAALMALAASPAAAQGLQPNLCLVVDATAEYDTVETWQIPQLIASGDIAILDVVPCEGGQPEAPAEPLLTGEFVGGWWVTDIVDDGSGAGVLAIAAAEAQTGAASNGQAYTMAIRCGDGEVDLIVTWNDVLESDQPTIETAVGSDAPESQPWNASTDQVSTFYPGESIRPFIESLYGETSLVFRTTPDGSEPWVADFPIAGIETALTNVREACEW